MAAQHRTRSAGRRPGPRLSRPLVVSLAIHAVVITFFVQALVMRHPLLDVFGRTQRRSPPEAIERIGFVQLPRPGTPPPAEPPRAGGDGRSRVASRTPVPRIIAPRAVPTALPPAPRTPSRVSEGPSSGPLVGGGGPLRGVQPRYSDPRLWVPGGAVVTAPKRGVAGLDSIIAEDVAAYNDSVAAARGSGRAPGDWTFERGGRRYGIDSRFIRLGPVSIPTAVLALLPLNITGNPTTMERDRTLTANHNEIFAQAQRGMNEADFRRAVREIRVRKERERRERELARRGGADTAAVTRP